MNRFADRLGMPVLATLTDVFGDVVPEQVHVSYVPIVLLQPSPADEVGFVNPQKPLVIQRTGD